MTPQPLKLSLDDVVAVTRESRAVVYDAIRAGHLRTFVVGRRRFATPAEAQRWEDYLRAESDAAGHVPRSPPG